jgi:hypothetical protein
MMMTTMSRAVYCTCILLHAWRDAELCNVSGFPAGLGPESFGSSNLFVYYIIPVLSLTNQRRKNICPRGMGR